MPALNLDGLGDCLMEDSDCDASPIDAAESPHLDHSGVLGPSTSHQLARTHSLPAGTPQSTARQPVRAANSAVFPNNHGESKPAPMISPVNKVMDIENVALARMAQVRLAWGIQFALAVAVQHGPLTWREVSTLLGDFHGEKNLSDHNEAAACILAGLSTQLGAVSHVLKNEALIQEYEREELALVEHRGRGLGLMKEEWHGASSGWFGGNIEQCATLTRTDDGDFGVLLRPPLLTYKSRIVSRFLGSRRMLQLSLKSLKTYDSAAVMAIRQFLASPLELLGRRFVLFHIKENKTAWFIETTHTLDEQFSTHASDRFRYPLEEVINWWNSLWSEDNSKQLATKWISRFALALSITTPVIEFAEENIYIVKDTYCAHGDQTEHCLTDGAGGINISGLKMIQEVLQFDTCPTAVQGRVAGAKGVWSQIRPTADADSLASKLHACRDPALFITESQKKSWVNFSGSTPLARAHRIFCLVKPAKVSTSVTLNKQSILCLWWGMMKQAKRHAAASESQPDYSVLEKLFTDTVRDGLRTTLYPFTNFDKPDSVLLLWNAVERAGGLTATRVRHVLAGHSRAQGWGQKFDKDEEDEDTPSGFDRRAYSGSPVSIHMTVLEMLLNGFHPKTCPKLHSDIMAIIKLVAANFLKDYHLPITDAIEAMFIPDFSGILKEGEVYFNPTGKLDDALEGEALIYRNPLGLASDCQKVAMVNKIELSYLSGVIVVSTDKSSQQSLVSKLSGGDLDGDIGTLIYNPKVVQLFDPSEVEGVPEGFMEYAFSRSEQKAKHHHDQLSSNQNLQSSEEREKHYITIFSQFLAHSMVGKYTVWHDKAIYQYGYNTSHSWELQTIANHELDGRKNGYSLKVAAHSDYLRDWDHLDLPKCLAPDSGSGIIPENTKPMDCTNNEDLQHGDESHFILTMLQTTAREEINRLIAPELKKLETPASPQIPLLDDQLMKPFRDLQSYITSPEHINVFVKQSNIVLAFIGSCAQLLSYRLQPSITAEDARAAVDRCFYTPWMLDEELKIIKAHVESTRNRFHQVASSSRAESAKSGKNPSPKKRSSTIHRNSQQGFDQVAKTYAEGPPEDKVPILTALGRVDAVKASYAYSGGGNFAWSVAFQELCRLKRQGMDGPQQYLFLDKMTIQPSVAKALKGRMEERMEDERAKSSGDGAEVIIQ